MDARELRIGNLVYAPNGAENYVFGTSYKTILYTANLENYTYGEAYDYECEPIPLTEEWLLKFGFDKTNECKDVEWYSLNSFDMAIHEEDNTVYIVYQHLVLRHITKVHQLQNLYFALCGKELQLQ